MPAASLTEPYPHPHPVPATVDFRSVLRKATSGDHARLDALFGRCDLQSLAGYRSFLEAHAMAVLPLEAALVRSGVERQFPDWPARSRGRALSADMTRLGIRIRVFPSLPRLDPEDILGTMYVLEGSRLGARFLLAQVQKSPDPAVASTIAYLSHGAGDQLWRSFLGLLEQYAAKLDDSAKVIAAARWTFSLFELAAADLAGREAVRP